MDENSYPHLISMYHNYCGSLDLFYSEGPAQIPNVIACHLTIIIVSSTLTMQVLKDIQNQHCLLELRMKKLPPSFFYASQLLWVPLDLFYSEGPTQIPNVIVCHLTIIVSSK